jgi:hypothetical protein
MRGLTCALVGLAVVAFLVALVFTAVLILITFPNY